MKKLPLSRRKYGYDYKQVFRNDVVAVYSQSEKGKVYAYEVFEVREKKGFYLDDTFIEASEKFPHDEAFGKWAWTVPTMERAMKKVREVEQKLIEKAKKKRAASKVI